MSRLKSAVARLEARVRRDDPHAQCNCGWAVSKRKAAACPPGQYDPGEINAIRRALTRLQSEVPPPKPMTLEERRATAAAQLAAARAESAKWERSPAELERCAICPEIKEGRHWARIRLRVAGLAAREAGCLDSD